MMNGKAANSRHAGYPRHPIHAALIAIPLGLLALVPICDLVHLAGAHSFGAIAFWMLTVGLIGGTVATFLELVDWLAAPPTARGAHAGFLRLLVSIAALGFFVLSFAARQWGQLPDNHWAPFVLALVGTVALVSGWLSGERFERLPARRPTEPRPA